MEHLFISAIALFIISVFAIKKFKTNKVKTSQLKGINYISQLKPLISLVQQHRGLTSAWLNGDESVSSKRVTIQKDIKQIIHLLNTHETSEHHNGFPNIGYVWRELVTLTENIGQARAIGTGVSVQKHCSSVDKIRLNFLAENMKKITTDTLDGLHYLPDEIDKHNNYIKIAKLKIEELTLVIAKDLVNTADITIKNQDYFALATTTISTFDDIFYHQVEQLKRLI